MKFLNSKILISSTLLLATFSGCVGELSLKKENNLSLPSWYINAPVNNKQFIYGEGEGSSLQEAKANALNSMAAKLVVNVSSSLQATTKTSTDNQGSKYSKDVTNDVKLDIEKIKFTNAKVEKSGTVSGKIYILMKVNREELFTNRKKEFDINDQRITKQINLLDNYPKLEQIHILQNIYPTIIDGKKSSIVLNAINNNFNHAPFMDKYDSYIDKIAELKNDSTIGIITNSKQRYFADSLIDMLNQEQYKITQNNSGDISIKLNNKIKYNMARGWNIAKVSTTLSVISANKIVSNRIITTIGRSSTSKQSALESASNSFKKQIQKEGLDSIIFSK